MSNIKTTYKVVSVLIITISILVFSAPPVSAESLASAAIVNGDYLWSRNMGGASDDKGYSIALDSSGNVYTTGSFQGTVDFDPGAGVSSLISAGKSDIFISKFDNNGNFMWARSMGGTSSDIGYGIAIDSNGNVYTTGYFEGNNIDFDPGPGTSLLTSVGSYDIFISKFDSNGNFVWAKSLDGTSGELGYSISVDSNGNVYTIGIFFLTVDFDPGSGVANLTSVGTHDIFISKLDGNGNFVWVKQLGGTSYDFGLDIDTDASGNIYSVGSFFGSTDFDPNAGAYNLSSAGQNDIFISKLDSNGNFLWAKRMGSTSYDGANGIAIDLSGNVYITGDFYFTVDFDPSAGTARLTSAGELDIFVSKLDGNGNFIWARSMGESEFDSGHEIAVDSRGNVYTTGNFTGTVDFDPSVGIANLSSVSATDDIFVSALDSQGNFAWAKSILGPSLKYSYSIALDPAGNVYTTGEFAGTVDFDPDTIGVFNLTSNAESLDIYLSKIENKTPSFTDVSFSYWANNYIERLYNAGITGGCGPNIYCPDSTVTRAQMAIFLLKGIHGSSYTPPSINGNTGFADVDTNYWSAAWIKQLAVEGITGGCGGGNYCPDTTVTRAQMAIFLLRAKHGSSYTPPNAAGVFTDVPLGYWADKWIEQLAIEGVTSGCGGGNYCPESSVTRAQMAVFLVKAFSLP